MKGDFSRLRDIRAKAYNRVLMQQGRVLLDSDWNEQAALLQEAVRLLASDLFGAHGGPAENLGFLVSKVGEDYVIGKGRYYVNGHMVENSKEGLKLREHLDPAEHDAFIKRDKPLLVYLDVWEDYVSPEQDGDMVEVALGGPDTCGRARTMWKLRIKQGKSVDDVMNLLKATGDGQMSAFTSSGKAAPDELCVVSPDSQYRGVENQLYRVEIHTGGLAQDVRYKWSRDNGALVYPIRAINEKSFELVHLGKDRLSSLSEGGWVEYFDDVLAAGAGVGIMMQVESIDRDKNSVKLTKGGVDFDSGRHPILRRWDHRTEDKESGCVKLDEGSEQPLEDGISIRFEQNGGGATHRTGDYWLIPARVATGDVDWPKQANDLPDPQEPHGPRHSYAPLLFVDAQEKDCRFKCEIRKPMS